MGMLAMFHCSCSVVSGSSDSVAVRHTHLIGNETGLLAS